MPLAAILEMAENCITVKLDSEAPRSLRTEEKRRGETPNAIRCINLDIQK
jgi:hypothetical protein